MLNAGVATVIPVDIANEYINRSIIDLESVEVVCNAVEHRPPSLIMGFWIRHDGISLMGVDSTFSTLQKVRTPICVVKHIHTIFLRV
jgi:hypothetical protein